MTQLEIALMRQNEHLQTQIEEMKSIATREAFYSRFFKICKHHSTREEALNELNELYHSFFKSYLFPNYNTFRKYLERKK